MVLSRRFASDPASDRLSAVADDASITADGSDATRVSFAAVDRYGAPRPYVEGIVTITIDGPGILIGESPFDFARAGGVGAVWIRSKPNPPGAIHVAVAHARLGTQTLMIQAA